ncbi:hypothetical protein CHARACLAT_017664 [Characodon lateralis]|uniref:Ubiquitin-like domain-containing protein n=1 Tax=Characodon lateralis TaxID=208331 RepID=A0ABU7EWZ9_9TELE|nr:hypothetical protein [Characodon lateralis]
MCQTDLLVVCSNNGEVSYLNTKEPLGKMTVLQLKQYAVNTFPKSGPTVNDIRLIVQDQPLDNDSASLSEYNIKSHAKVQMVRKVNGG